jgi:hypothetical protein
MKSFFSEGVQNELHVKWWVCAESQWTPLQKFTDEQIKRELH